LSALSAEGAEFLIVGGNETDNCLFKAPKVGD
jgi:hypothetical protein